MDTSTHAYQVATYRPDLPLEGHKTIIAQEQTAEYNVTRLSNGFTVLTESTVIPGPVNMGIMVNAGTRDETSETSGACASIKNTYLKTIKHTNETLNYIMGQMCGGHLRMNYDQETMFFNS